MSSSLPSPLLEHVKPEEERLPLADSNRNNNQKNNDTNGQLVKIHKSNQLKVDDVLSPVQSNTKGSTRKYTIGELLALKKSPLSMEEPAGFTNWPTRVRKGARSPQGLANSKEDSFAEARQKSTQKSARKSPAQTNPWTKQQTPKKTSAWNTPTYHTPASLHPPVNGFATPMTAPAQSRRALAFPSPGGSVVRNMQKQPPATTQKVGLKQKETDDRRIRQRAKQISYGENTLGFKIAHHPKLSLMCGKSVPRAPAKDQKCSKRCWDAQVRRWRLLLHQFDPNSPEQWRGAAIAFPKECAELVQANADGKASPTSAPFQSPPADIFDGLNTDELPIVTARAVVDSNDCSTTVEPEEDQTFNITPMKQQQAPRSRSPK